MNILYITTVGETMGFFKQFIRELMDQGHNVELACSNPAGIPAEYRNWGNKIHELSCTRSPFNKGNLKAIKEIREIVNKEHFDIVHCHTPVAAMCTRIACNGIRKSGTKVLYTAHGFHFYSGAPKKNWLLYYPVEWICAWMTDAIITINHEDYQRALHRFHSRKVYLIPGIGVQTEKFMNCDISKEEKRRELDVPKDSFILLTVGELHPNKNHQVIIRAMNELNNPDIHLFIAGAGAEKDVLNNLTKQLSLEKQVHFLGYRRDVNELCRMADVFCFPSVREGLGLAGIEAMASGLPIITSRASGIMEYSINGVTGYNCESSDVTGFAKAIEKIKSEKETDPLRFKGYGLHNIEVAKTYDKEQSLKAMRMIYSEVSAQ